MWWEETNNHWKSGVAFQLHTVSNPKEIILIQNIEKTHRGVFLKDQESGYGHFKIKQKVFPNLLPNFIDSKPSDYLDYVFSKDILLVLVKYHR